VLSAVVSPLAPAWADTAIVVGGFGTPTPNQSYMDTVLGGTVSGPGWTRIGITYPATGGPLLSGPGSPTVGQSVSQGAETIYQTIIATHDRMIVTGTSEGSAVVDAAQARLVDDPNAPDPDQITFVYTAPLEHHDPALATSFLWYLQGIPIPFVDFTPRPPVQDSQYNTVVLAGEYDWAADFPDRPWNLVADLNAVMAGLYPSAMSIHGATALADPDPANYPADNVHSVTNSKGATITTILVPTKRLPLLEPLREMGIPSALVDVAEKFVRPIVDAGYSRNDSRHPLIPHLPPVTAPILGDHAAPLPSQDNAQSDAAEDDTITAARKREGAITNEAEPAHHADVAGSPAASKLTGPKSTADVTSENQQDVADSDVNSATTTGPADPAGEPGSANTPAQSDDKD
jgi:hypothetical protein